MPAQGLLGKDLALGRASAIAFLGLPPEDMTCLSKAKGAMTGRRLESNERGLCKALADRATPT